MLCTPDLEDLPVVPSGPRGGVCWGEVSEQFSVHTGLFLASEKQDVQRGLYGPGGAGGLPARRKCTSFLLQMLALTPMAEKEGRLAV